MSKSPKILKSHYGGGGGGFTTNFQLSMLSPNLLKSKIPYMVGWVGVPEELLMLCPDLLKSKISYMMGAEVVWWFGDDQFPTFNAVSKSAKILKSHCGGGGRGGLQPISNFQC